MIFKLPYKDNKLQWKKQERFGYFSPTNLTDVHRFLNFQLSINNYELCIKNYELTLGVPASRRAFRYIFFR